MLHGAGVPAYLITASDRIRRNWMLVMITIGAEKVKFVGSIALRLWNLLEEHNTWWFSHYRVLISLQAELKTEYIVNDSFVSILLISYLLTVKRAKWWIALQQIITRLGVELLKLELECLTRLHYPHTRRTVWIVTGVIGWHNVLI